MLSRNVWLKIASLPRQGLSVVFEDELSDIYISGYSRTNHNVVAGNSLPRWSLNVGSEAIPGGWPSRESSQVQFPATFGSDQLWLCYAVSWYLWLVTTMRHHQDGCAGIWRLCPLTFLLSDLKWWIPAVTHCAHYVVRLGRASGTHLGMSQKLDLCLWFSLPTAKTTHPGESSLCGADFGEGERECSQSETVLLSLQWSLYSYLWSAGVSVLFPSFGVFAKVFLCADCC
jgi:hypothetical protein